jgi:hypothetical protein
MKKILSLILLLASTSLWAQPGLRYQWKTGMVQRFKTTQKDVVSMGGGGMMGMMAMAGNMEFTTESVFSLTITQVSPNGSATGSFFLNDFKVTDNKGNVLANMKSLPKRAIEADFTVDSKGNFTFTEIPMLICRDSGNLLVTTKVEKGEMATSAEADGEKVTLFAEFNPKTGSLKAGYTAATIAKPKPKVVTVKEDDETIDLLPTEYLDLLVLPEGTLGEGQSFKTKMYTTEITETMESFQQNVARLRFDIASSLNSRQFEKDAKKMAGDDDEPSDAEMAQPEMDGFGGMPGMGGAGGNETPDIGQDMSGTFTMQFDNGMGMFKDLNGFMQTKSNMMGMETSTKTTLKMTAIP